MQKAYSFDKESLVKAAKGAVFSALAVAGLFILKALGTVEFDNQILASFMVWIIPFVTNSILEWRKGEPWYEE